MMFVELKKQEYYRGGYISDPAMFAIDEFEIPVEPVADFIEVKE